MADKKNRVAWSEYARYNEEQALGEILKRITASGVFADKILEKEISSIYERIVGPQVSRMTQNLFVRKSKLYIKVESSALKQELVYSREKIKTMVNEALEDKQELFEFKVKKVQDIVIL